jgi:hypothetical protein
MDALSAFENATESEPACEARTADELNGVPKKGGPVTSKTSPLHVPALAAAPEGMVQFDATYHFGLPAAS